ncbi:MULTISPECIES: hypothetical protein [Thalassospira]|nr:MULTISPECIES: hypothetical protein [Thalassospira]NJB75862.1 hypothetical protein [Thalassospira tepidiphila]
MPKTVHGTNVIPAQAGTPNRKLKTYIDRHNPEAPMGSLFSTPKPARAAPPVSKPAAVKPEDDTSAEDAARTARTEALERRRYGRASLIGTSYRGLLTDRIAKAGGGKNLLGE